MMAGPMLREPFVTRARVLAVLTLLLAACAHTPPSPKNPTVKLIAFNDFHGNLEPPYRGITIPNPDDPEHPLTLPSGGAAYLASAVRALKAENPQHVVVAAGDLVGAAPPVSSLFFHEPAIRALDLIGLEFSAVGNHEFDKGLAELQRLQNGGCRSAATPGLDTCADGPYGGAKFRYLGANVIDESTGRSAFPPYLIKRFRFGGREIGIAFIGETLEGTPDMVTASGIAGLRFADEADTANALVPEIRAQGVEAIVLLIHEGADIEGGFDECVGASGAILPIVERLDPAIDVVISGHTHQAYNCELNGRLLTSAGSYGRLISDIELQLDPLSGDILSARAHNLPVVNQALAAAPQWPPYPAYPPVAELIEHYRALAAPRANRIVGQVTAPLTRSPNAAGETTLGNHIADAQLAATRIDGAQIAFMNPGGVRADLGSADGSINWGQAFTTLPFGNNLVTMTLSGAQIHALLEAQWRGGPDNYLLQVSEGFQYAWDGRQPPGQRIAADSLKLHGETLDPKARYRVSVNSFLAGGGDGYAVLKQGTDVSGGPLDLDALLDWLKAHSALAPQVEGRIQRLDSP